jgi:Ca2+-binding RTX toxin-like protein
MPRITSTTILVRLTAGLAVLLGAALLPQAADAASVERSAAGDVFYSADAGENNEVLIADLGSDVRLTDVVPVTAGLNCIQIDTYSARCPDAGLGTIVVYAGDGINVVESNDGHPTIMSGSSATKNTFRAGTGPTTLQGSDNPDVLEGGPAIDEIDGGLAGDVVTGGEANDELAGGFGDDEIDGGSGGDHLDGGFGDDILDGGAGPDSIGGGPDSDVADYSNRMQAVRVTIGGNLLVGNDGAPGEGDFVGASVENVHGGAGDDLLSATAGYAVNRLLGNGGNDELLGGPGPDTLVGGLGDDMLDGASEGDILDGGDGVDGVSYSSSAAGVRADLDEAPHDDGIAGEGDSIYEVENLIGSRFADRLTGNDAANIIKGGRGRDLIVGLLRRDRLVGGAGRDALRSRDQARDRVRCGGGSDAYRSDRADRLRACERRG